MKRKGCPVDGGDGSKLVCRIERPVGDVDGHDKHEWLLSNLWEIVWAYGLAGERAMWCVMPIFAVFRRLLPANLDLWLEGARASVTAFRWATEQGPVMDDGRICAEAAARGDEEIISVALEFGCATGAMQLLWAERGDVARLQWLCAKGVAIHRLCWREAVRHDRISVLKWLLDINCQLPGGRGPCRPCANVEMAMQGSASLGDSLGADFLPMLRWLRAREPPTPWSAYACASAAENGHLETLQWLRANGCEWDQLTTCYAARSGRLEVLEWALGQDPPAPVFDHGLCAIAAEGGQLPVLQWLRARTPPERWDARVLREAAFHATSADGDRHRQLAEWAIAHGCPHDARTRKSILAKWPHFTLPPS